jgi:hypothetical protein
MLLSERSMEDILAERIRLPIGGQVYDLPVLPIAENRVWKERMDLELGLFLVNIVNEDDTDAILRLFDQNEALFLDLLVSYDTTHVLPGWTVENEKWRFNSEAIEAAVTPLALIRMVLEVWRAARPLADIARSGTTLMLEPPTNVSHPHTPTWWQRITGQRDTSRQN